jgi:hypothetical protein
MKTLWIATCVAGLFISGEAASTACISLGMCQLACGLVKYDLSSALGSINHTSMKTFGLSAPFCSVHSHNRLDDSSKLTMSIGVIQSHSWLYEAGHKKHSFLVTFINSFETTAVQFVFQDQPQNELQAQSVDRKGA